MPFVSVPERRKRLTTEGMAVLLLHLFYVGGLANNVYLFFRLYKSRSPPDYSYNSIALVQLLLNACNIITHAMLELSKQHIWRTLSASSSFLAVYFLATLIVCIAAGRPLRQRMNSKLNTAILLLFFSGLFVMFGRKFDLCASDNCFSLNLANTEDNAAIFFNAIAHFHLPTVIIFSASWYHGQRKYFTQTAEKPSPNFLISLVRLDSSGAVFLFIVYGILVVNGILYFNENNDITMPNKLCRIRCLDENLYLLLSIFPVYMGHFIKGKKEKPQQQGI